jgi:hypothetical protein
LQTQGSNHIIATCTASPMGAVAGRETVVARLVQARSRPRLSFLGGAHRRASSSQSGCRCRRTWRTLRPSSGWTPPSMASSIVGGGNYAGHRGPPRCRALVGPLSLVLACSDVGRWRACYGPELPQLRGWEAAMMCKTIALDPSRLLRVTKIQNQKL